MIDQCHYKSATSRQVDRMSAELQAQTLLKSAVGHEYDALHESDGLVDALQQQAKAT